MKDRTFPTINRDCPKCPSTVFNGPEYRRGIGTDADLGEHMRLYCKTCGYMIIEPTKDHDTPERRAELTAALAARKRLAHAQVDTAKPVGTLRPIRRW